LHLEGSDGGIRVIDRKGMCPGGWFQALFDLKCNSCQIYHSIENMLGSICYEGFLKEMDVASYAEKWVKTIDNFFLLLT
jgi:hypothetical protein